MGDFLQPRPKKNTNQGSSYDLLSQLYYSNASLVIVARLRVDVYYCDLRFSFVSW